MDRGRLGLRMRWLAHDLGLTRVDPRPDEAEPRAAPGILTVVLRPDPATVAELADLALELTAIDSRQYAYPPESIHVTLIDAAGIDPDRVVTDVRRAVTSLRGAGARTTGFALSRSTAFAAIAVDHRLREVRVELGDAWDRPWQPGVARRLAGDPWHATVLRLTAPPSRPFAERLRHQRPDPGARVTFRSVDVVRTNKVMAPARTTTLASFDLG